MIILCLILVALNCIKFYNILKFILPGFCVLLIKSLKGICIEVIVIALQIPQYSHKSPTEWEFKNNNINKQKYLVVENVWENNDSFP